MTTMPNPHGRPSPPPEEALDDRLTTRVNAIEHRQWKAAAKAAKMSFSRWVRAVLNDAVLRKVWFVKLPKSPKRKAKR
jgi:predicted HicB family RNase H-like nuclease